MNALLRAKHDNIYLQPHRTMPLKILIVEDEVLIAETLKLHLEALGHEVLDLCISYEEAIDSYQQQIPDIAILDIRLYGEKSGVDFANYLCKQKAQIPFIFLTSQNDRRIFEKALDTSPYGYLSKPVRKETLWTTIEVAYNKYLNDHLLTSELQVYDGQQNHRLKESNILYIKAEHVYSYVYLKYGEKIVTRTPLREIEQEVNAKIFCRCHRSHIINTMHISSWDNENATMSDGHILSISKSKRKVLKGFL